MPFTDPVSNLSGRNSRASNVSGMTGASQPTRPPPQAGVPNETLSNAGVLSMLKTSTDTGNIGALSLNNARLPSMPRSAHQRRSHTSHANGSTDTHHSLSSSYHHHVPSQASRASLQLDTISAHRRGSLASMRSMPPTLVQAQHLGHTTPRMPPPAARGPRDSRSYSLTSTLPGQPLPYHRSTNSLKTRVQDPRLHSHIPPDQSLIVPDNRSPLIYPTRLRRPGFRSPSPAPSELHLVTRGVPVPQPVQPPSQAMHRGYNNMYTPDSRHLTVRPPPRAARSSLGGTNFDPTQLPHRPSMMRPPPPMMMPKWSSSPSDQSNQRLGLAPANSIPPGGPHARVTPIPISVGHPSRPPMRFQDPRGPRSPPNVAPMVHHMFHNAARLARNLPQRSDTHMTDIGPSSSDPPSSRSLPSSSNPPTPRDHDNIQVTIDPALVDPALADLSESPSEPVHSARNFEYVEGIDKPVDEADSGLPYLSVPPSGFVQRVKAMLESKAAADATMCRFATGLGLPVEEVHELAADNSNIEEAGVGIHELAADELPRFTLVEEFIAPSELPASPVKTTGTQTRHSSGEQVSQRITREIIKAELGPSSVDNTIHHPEGEDTSHIVIRTGRERKVRRRTDEVSAGHLGIRDDDDLVSTSSTTDSIPAISKPGNESASTISVRASLPSGADYALRFTLHLDSTRSSAETYSKDHFGLDAESLRQRQSDVYTSQNRKTPAVKNVPIQQHDRVPEEPVSPLKPEDHNVSRHSAVSPVHTQTLGIDETLQMSMVEKSEMHSVDRPSIPGSFPDDLSPPPSPRALKNHARSVRLPPPSSTTPTDTTSTNRYSLPGDLSSIGDTSTHTTTEMVTDVAVRFSLPQTATTAGKAQIVDVASSPAPVKSNDESTPSSNSERRGAKAPVRNSVTFADEVAPLAISKRTEPPGSIPKSTESPASINNKPIFRKPSPRESQHDPGRASCDSSIELRFPNTNNANRINGRFGSKHLPDLKEESVEDESAAEAKRNSIIIQDQQFPMPARIAAVKAMQDRRLKESGERAQARRTLRHRHKTLAEIRDLPSLNFSQMNLIDKLNEALDVRTTRSLDFERHHDYPNIYCPSPQRPQSTEPLRERYMSFFSKPESFSEGNVQVGDVEVEEPGIDEQETSPADDREHSDDEDEPIIRSLSPDTFLSFAREVNRLSIPSVAGLSERLSELIPGLRNLHSLQLDGFLGTWSDDRSLDVNEFARPDTVLSNRTSTAFRALAERAEEIVKNGTHDSVQSTKGLALNKALPSLPESVSANDVVAGHTADVKQSYLSGSVSVPTDLDKDVARPTSAVVRDRTPTTEEEVRELLPPGINPIARAARRSLTVSQASSRPWNLDENYPWATDKMDIDLVVPKPARLVGSSPKSIILDKSMTKSLGSTAGADATGTIRGIDIGSIIDPNDSGGSATTEQLTGVDSAHLRKSSKRSIIGSITRKLGFSDHHTTTADEESATQNLTSASYPTNPCTNSTTHTSSYLSAGDRYPTTGLSPPDAFNLDEVRSFFSDNSSEAGGRTPSLRMRLAQLKGKRKTVRIRAPDSVSLEGPPSHHHLHPQSSHHHQQHHHRPHRTGFDPTAAPLTDQHEMMMMHTGLATPYSSSQHRHASVGVGVGMGKTEFHLKRFGEKLRHLLVRGGELFRSWSWRSSSASSASRARAAGRAQARHGAAAGPASHPAGRERHEDWLANEDLE